mmetsp:Transcript_6787/g.12687  ORF Transcript_6787/g.12687 Transcript_6787/m.12687 type:complete len:859 (-) Transcript_6787:302-2878(-)
MGTGASAHLRDGDRHPGAPPDLFMEMGDFLHRGRSRALELFREFDKSNSGYLDRRELTSLVLTILPNVKRRELRYFRAMLDMDGDGKVSFAELNEFVKECKHAATLAREKRVTLYELKNDMRKLVRNSRREAVRLFNEFDLNRSGYLEHGEVVRLVRFLKPNTSMADLRYLMANLYIIDEDQDGRISINEILHELGLSQSPSQSRQGSKSPARRSADSKPAVHPATRDSDNGEASAKRFQDISKDSKDEADSLSVNPGVQLSSSTRSRALNNTPEASGDAGGDPTRENPPRVPSDPPPPTVTGRSAMTGAGSGESSHYPPPVRAAAGRRSGAENLQMRDGRDTRGDAGGAVRATDYSIQGPIQPSHSAPARYADRPDLAAPPAMRTKQPPAMAAKEELRKAVDMHKEYANQLSRSTKMAQEAMSMDADELRRDARRLEDFHEEVGKLSAALGVRALEVEQGLKSGFQRVRALLDEREKELVAQVADVAAERMGVCRAQQDRVQATQAEVGKILAMAEAADNEQDPATVLQMSEEFDAALSVLHASGRTKMLEPATNIDMRLEVDFDHIVHELKGALDFDNDGEGVTGSLRGPAAMHVLREVFNKVDRHNEGHINKQSLMDALQHDTRVIDLLKLPLKLESDGLQPMGAETFEDVFRRIDVDNSFKISWPEFASYFGQSLYSITGTNYPKRQAWVAGSKSRNSSADRLAQAPSTSHQTRDAELKDSLYEDATREAERLADMLERTESFISHQASEYEERVRILEEEKVALQSEYEAKFKAQSEETASKQADFERRLTRALDRSEAALGKGGKPSNNTSRKALGDAETSTVVPPLYPAFNSSKSRALRSAGSRKVASTTR